MYQSCGATMWRRAMPALSNTPASRSNNALFPPNASRARLLASCCSITCGGTAVASESKLQGCIMAFISGPQPNGGSRYGSRIVSDDQAAHASCRFTARHGLRQLQFDYGPDDEQFHGDFHHHAGGDLR